MDLNDEEMERITAMAELRLTDARAELAEAEAEAEKERKEEKGVDGAQKKDEEEDELKEYNLDAYDDDEDEDGDEGNAPPGVFNNIQSLSYYAPGEKDPYLEKPEEDLEQEKEELEILPTDNLILAAKTENDVSYLEVYVYNEDREADVDENGDFEPSLYVHHDVMLPSFPLCVEWFDYNGTETSTGNMAAVGTFDPEIEIWDLDVVDAMYPRAILGQQQNKSEVKLKKKKKGVRTHQEYHTDAVLSLSANRLHRNLLLSGSADTTVKLWDLNTATAAKSCEIHKGKVSNVAWNPVESTVILTGGYDGNAVVSDLRVSDVESQGSRKWDVNADVEGVKWASNGNEFYVATETGRIHKFDARQEGKSLWTLQAHESEITSFDVNQFVDGYMVTAASADKQIKLWNLEGRSSNSGPSLVLARDLDVGKVFSVGFGPERQTLGHVTVAGSSGIVKVWDTMTNKTVRRDIGARLRTSDSIQDRKEVIVGPDMDAGRDDSDASDDNDENEDAAMDQDLDDDDDDSSSEDEV